MADHSAQDRTEEPTARKLQKAREDGQVARSTELPAAVIVIGAFLLMVLMGGWLVDKLSLIFANGFVFDRKTLDRPSLLPGVFGAQLLEAFIVMLPIVVFTVVAAVVASGMTGGYLFSLKAVAPKGSKINPINGFKRMFGPRALIELTKAGIIQLGLRTGVDFGLTHSCYDPAPDGRPCGECDSCLLRAKGFAEAGVADPLLG